MSDPKPFTEVLAAVQLLYGSAARQALQDLHKEDPAGAMELGLVSLDPKVLEEKHRIDASIRLTELACKLNS